MKKVVFGIFAHPDDEAFGPAGTLLRLKAEGCDIHLILLTDGEAGSNPDDETELGIVRLAEWRRAAKILGADSIHALHYPDGGLDRIAPEQLTTSANAVVAVVLGTYTEPTEVSFMTFEPAGLTGHRDHIAASNLTTRIAEAIGPCDIWYFCLDGTQAPLEDTAYYEPRARQDDYITTRVDVAHYLPDIYRMIDAHISQRSDGTNRKALGEERLSVECFHVERVNSGLEF